MHISRHSPHGGDRHGVAGPRNRHLRWYRRVLALLAVAVVLGACADGEENRQFANDPQVTEDVVGQPPRPAPTRIVQPTAVTSTPLAQADVLAIRGSSPRLFIAEERGVRAIDLGNGVSSLVYRSKDAEIIATAGSPAGDRVAILTTAGNDRRLRVLDASGEEIGSADLAPTGTPVSARDGAGTDAIAWAADGSRMLVTSKGGGIVEVTVDGSTRTILSPAQAPAPRAVTWSPAGSAIAYVDAGPAGTATGLYVASIEALPLDPVTIVRPIEGRRRQIEEIAWAGGSVGILYAERDPGGDLSIGGDLFAVPAAGGQPRLIATAGGVAQVGAVGTFAVSPDGRAVAYTVLTPSGADRSAATRLVVHQVDGPTEVPLAVTAGNSVAGFAWTTEGVVWAETGPNGSAVMRAASDGTSVRVDRSEASPAASPAASPEVASPAATPIG